MGQTQAGADWRGRFLVIWASQAVSLVGSSIAGFAIVWWLAQTTGSATILAASALVSSLPFILVGPLAGTLVDRLDRRLVMMCADGFVALVSAWLAYLFWTGQMRPGYVFVIMVARSVGGAFQWPAMQASTTLMVPKEQLSRVAGMNQTVQAAMGILSPPVGALLLSLLPLHGIMAIDVGTAVIAISLLAAVPIPRPQRADLEGARAARPSLWQDFRAGLAYVVGWRGLAALIAIAALTNLVLSPASALMPILVTKHFHGGPGHLAALESAFSVGMVVGGLVLAAWGGFRRRMVTILLGLVVEGLVALPFGLLPAGLFALVVVCTAGFGFTMPLVNGPITAVMQSTVDPAMQGRVMSVTGSLAQAAAPIGLIVAGPLADAVGVEPVYVVAALVCLSLGIAGFFIPALFRFEDGRGAVPPAAPAAAVPAEAP
jgi:MFS transporter, DHA3 family, macrolide efflux protein